MAAEMDLKWSPSFFEELGTSREVTSAVMGMAEAAAEAARATAPVDTGDYKSGIKTDLRRGRGRNVGRVEFTDPKSLLVESRTGNAYRAIRAVKGR